MNNKDKPADDFCGSKKIIIENDNPFCTSRVCKIDPDNPDMQIANVHISTATSIELVEIIDENIDLDEHTGFDSETKDKEEEK